MRISDWSSDVCSSDLHYMSDGRRSLFIQSDTFLIIEADVIECGAAPAHADIDMPLARLVLTDANVSNRPAWRALRRQLAFQYEFSLHCYPATAICLVFAGAHCSRALPTMRPVTAV